MLVQLTKKLEDSFRVVYERGFLDKFPLIQLTKKLEVLWEIPADGGHLVSINSTYKEVRRLTWVFTLVSTSQKMFPLIQLTKKLEGKQDEVWHEFMLKFPLIQLTKKLEVLPAGS